MKLDIILSGVGGQGILSIAAIVGEASLSEGLHIKQAEVHGMSQRGGDVQSNLRISSSPIYSDLIAKGTANAIISLEPMEALRYIPYLSKDGWIVANSTPFVNILAYPELGTVLDELRSFPNVILIDVDAIAKEAKNPRATNMVLLGAASVILGIDANKLEDAIARIFGRKGENIVEMNKTAFRLGREAGEKQIKK
ncbi:indolepyruvate oxidoreductase subunit beta [Dysgonomonas sp. 520]|uniref:indolepyruvate oxidoreductase subunit beta n=1 Tax=Dysgonomonas sp. 520 TaxID=2302931 RepID=UPI0013D07A57|nr:indolepyruvate oxidoreductase subunit beta [Dysgonomonas sp. 520]NDW09253.1 indolepyruvate oxidoreductase subunit beta [Dysgonomonas sp. 520]